MVAIVKELLICADDLIVVTCSHDCQVYIVHGKEVCGYKDTLNTLSRDKEPWHPFFLRPTHPGKWHTVLNIHENCQIGKVMYSINIITPNDP